MIFESLNEARSKGRLLLIEGGMCHWNLRRDSQLTILEIFSTQPGAGKRMLEILKSTPGASSLFAKCPVDLPGNAWYDHNGFVLEGQETTKTGRKLNLWRLKLT